MPSPATSHVRYTWDSECPAKAPGSQIVVLLGGNRMLESLGLVGKGGGVSPGTLGCAPLKEILGLQSLPLPHASHGVRSLLRTHSYHSYTLMPGLRLQMNPLIGSSRHSFPDGEMVPFLLWWLSLLCLLT